MKTLIITTAVGYRPADIWPFLASAARHCPDASIIAIVHERDLAGLSPCCDRFSSLTLHPIRTHRKSILHTQGFRFKLQRILAKVRSWTLARLTGLYTNLTLADERPSLFGLSSQNMFILNRRFFIARQLLRSLATPPDAVLLTDSRDVVFQADPFTTMQNGLFTGLEFNRIRDSPINAQWIRSTYGEAGFQYLAEHAVLCSGVTIGSFGSIVAYLNLFCSEISRKAVALRSVLIPIWDQAYHNMILRQQPPADLSLMPWNSWLSTVAEVPSEYLTVQSDGSMLVSGVLPAILHQYDRHPVAVAMINSLYPLSIDGSQLVNR